MNNACVLSSCNPKTPFLSDYSILRITRFQVPDEGARVFSLANFLHRIRFLKIEYMHRQAMISCQQQCGLIHHLNVVFHHIVIMKRSVFSRIFIFIWVTAVDAVDSLLRRKDRITVCFERSLDELDSP